MKNLLCLFVFFILLPAVGHSQRLSRAEKEKIINRVAKNTCDCISELNVSGMTQLQVQQQLGICMMEQIAKWDNTRIRDFDIDFNDYDKMYKFGERVGKKMATNCPSIMRRLTGQSDNTPLAQEDFPLDEVTYQTCLCADEIEPYSRSQEEVNEALGNCIFSAVADYSSSQMLAWGIDLSNRQSTEALGYKIGTNMAALCPEVVQKLNGKRKSLSNPNNESVGAPPRPSQDKRREIVNPPSTINKQPPLLSIEEISLSEATLTANGNITLNISIRNVGPGAAEKAYIQLSGYTEGLNYPAKTPIPTINAYNNTQTVSIPLNGSVSIKDATANLKVEVIEPEFNVKIPGKSVTFQTKSMLRPQLILAQYALKESQSSSPNKKVDINEIIDLTFSIQNIGQGNANDIKVHVNNYQAGVTFLGVVENGQVLNKKLSLEKLEAGKYQTLTHRYFINSDFKDQQIVFTIDCEEQTGNFGFKENKAFAINTTLKEEGYIRVINPEQENGDRKVVIEEVPPLSVDVDVNIPTSPLKKTQTYALIIGNEDYQSKQRDLNSEQNVPFAENDARIFSQYCEKVLGVPAKQIKLLLNATAAEIYQGLAWISNLAEIEGPNAELIFYYSGHGLPDEQSKDPYIVPVDVSGNNLAYAVKLTDVYNKLSNHPTAKTTVFLDACFSGGGRNASLVNSRGVRIKAKPAYLKNNLVVFASSSGEESSSAMPEKQHGFFTYFVLKKLQETKGSLTYGELSDYLYKQVRKESGLLGKIQTPNVSAGEGVATNWETLRFDN